jgi:hypothetical protein
MRHSIDTYIEADEARVISQFENVPLLELIVKSGIADAVASLLAGVRKNKDAVAETIANNVQARENVVKGAIYSVVQDEDEVERLFKIITQHKEY